MKTLALLLFFFATLSSAGAQSPADIEIARQITGLNAEARKRVGLDLLSIAMLVNTSDGSYMPRWSLERERKLPTIKKLQVAGFVTVTVVRGLPDGSEPEEEFYSLSRTPKGVAAVRALLGE